MRVAAPNTFRAVVENFAQFEAATGLQGLLDLWDFEGVTRHQVYSAVLRRIPEFEVLKANVSYSPKEHFRAALQGDEFQKGILQSVADAFPEKERLIFVHIPKTAGTDLSEALSVRFPYLNFQAALPHIVDKPSLFRRLREFSINVRLSNSIFMSGHLGLDWYLRHGLCRSIDNVFTILREPKSIVLSNANFIVTRMTRDAQLDPRAAAEWKNDLGITSIPESPSADLLRDLALRVLYHPVLTSPNFMCQFLGKGRFEQAIKNIATANVEVTDVRRYDKWKAKRWNIAPGSRRNESLKIISPEDLSGRERDFLEEITQEDQKLYDLVAMKLDTFDYSSVRGTDLL